MGYPAAHPLISVIVPVYNVEKYLARCLDSIVGQTYKNLEIILVNDGSTDHSGEICRQYAQGDSRIRLFVQENRGLSAARNVGLEHMEGQYIVFVDSDDYISPYLVETLLGKLLEFDVPIAVCNYLEVDDGDDNATLDIIPVGQTNFCKKMSRDEVFDTMGTDRLGSFLVAHCKMYDKKIFEELKYPVGKIYEDGFVFHKVYIQVENVCYVDMKLYAYRKSLNSITRKSGVWNVHMEDHIDMYMEQLAFFQQYEIRKYGFYMKKLLVSDLTHDLSGCVDKGKAKQYIKEIEKRVYLITGTKLFVPKWMLFKISPELYQFMRICYLKVKQFFHPL